MLKILSNRKTLNPSKNKEKGVEVWVIKKGEAKLGIKSKIGNK